MENEHELRVSEFLVNHNLNKTSGAEGYYTQEDMDRKALKETMSLYNSLEQPQKSHIDMLKLISEILPKIDNSRERLIIEKFLEGYSIREICKIIGYKSPSSVHKIIQKHKDLIKETYEDECAIQDLFQGNHYIYMEPIRREPMEKEVSQARVFLEHIFGFKTYIYPFDISSNSYKITLKHPAYGTHKFSQRGLIKFTNEMKKKLKENKDE